MIYQGGRGGEGRLSDYDLYTYTSSTEDMSYALYSTDKESQIWRPITELDLLPGAVSRPLLSVMKQVTWSFDLGGKAILQIGISLPSLGNAVTFGIIPKK